MRKFKGIKHHQIDIWDSLSLCILIDLQIIHLLVKIKFCADLCCLKKGMRTLLAAHFNRFSWGASFARHPCNQRTTAQTLK